MSADSERLENSRVAKRTIKSLGYVLGGSILFACGFVLVSVFELLRTERSERIQLISMTNAFTRAFSESRVDGTPVPATFRRIGIDHFSDSKRENMANGDTGASLMRMPGTPGLELNTVEENQSVRAAIAQMAAQQGDAQGINEHRLENGRFIARSIVPSVATAESCVACHNGALGEEIYQLGDVMGAFVVETDLTESLRDIGFYAVGAFSAAVVAGLLLARRLKQRTAAYISALESAVEAEKERSEAEAYAAFVASHDALTGLASRKLFRERLDDSLVEGRTILLLVDLDDFKRTNDSHGHDAGDALLISIAERLKCQIDKRGGVTARLGGDEFAAVFSGSADFQADRFGDALIADIMQDLRTNGIVLRPSVSIGIATSDQLDQPNASSLQKAADLALYAAKENGKGQHWLFDATLKTTMGRRAAMAQALADALSRDELDVAYQPQVDLAGGFIDGFEALARWMWRGEHVSPSEFISVAENNNLIVALDLAVVRQSLTFAKKCARTFSRCPAISCNASAATVLSGQLVEAVRDALFETGVPPERLILEFTETVIMDNWDQASGCLSELQEMGVRISLDDFGTGYSSLSYLTHFPFDCIKIDRSFVTRATESASDRIVSSHVISLAKSLNKRVVVEGIETQEQEDLFFGLGADLGQGFLYSPAVSAELAGNFLSGDGGRETA